MGYSAMVHPDDDGGHIGVRLTGLALYCCTCHRSFYLIIYGNLRRAKDNLVHIEFRISGRKAVPLGPASLPLLRRPVPLALGNPRLEAILLYYDPSVSLEYSLWESFLLDIAVVMARICGIDAE